MISDILSFKGFRGWTCGDTADTLTWNEGEAGRPAPSAGELVSWEAEYISARIAAEAQAAADEQAKDATKSDNVIQYLVTHTPADCAAYVDANVNNLADAKAFLGKVAIALSVLARREFR